MATKDEILGQNGDLSSLRSDHSGVEAQINGASAGYSLAKAPGVVKQEALERAAADGERDVVAGYDRQIDALRRAAESVMPETEAQRRERERRERSKRIVGAVSDGLSALANLYFTSQYAPSMGQVSHLGKVNERIEKLRAEREANAERFNNYMLKIGDAENNRAKTLREIEAEHERRKIALEKAKRDAEQHKWEAALQPDKQREQKGKADRAEAQAVADKALAEYAEDYQLSRINKNNYRRPVGGGGGTGKKTSEWKAYNPETKEELTIYASSRDNAWSQCPQGYIIRQAPSETKIITEEKDGKGKTIKSEEKTTSKNADGKTGGVKPQTDEKNTEGGFMALARQGEQLAAKESQQPKANKGKGYGQSAGKGRGY